MFPPALCDCETGFLTLMTLSYIDHLEEALRSNPPVKKGQRTRERIRLSTARILETKGFHALRILDITEDANIAEGSFYVYFKDKSEVTLDVLSSLLLEFLNLQGRTPGVATVFESIRASNRRWISVCRSNCGLIRCIFQFSDEEPEFGVLAQRSNRRWYEYVAQSVLRRRGGDPRAALLATYLLGSMMDELVRKLIIYPDPEFQCLLDELQADDDAVADAASVVWLKILYPEERPGPELTPAAARLSEFLWPA